MIIQSNRYGLHNYDGLVFLHEQHRSYSLSAGLDDLQSPFMIKPEGRGVRCPHQFGPPKLDDEPASTHPLIVAMGAQQEGGLFHVYPEHEAWLRVLAGMTPCLERIIEPVWCINTKPAARWVAGRLGVTNIAPLVIVDMEAGNLFDMEQMAQLPRTRNLILSGPLKVPDAVVLNPEGLEISQDWMTEGRRQFTKAIERIKS